MHTCGPRPRSVRSPRGLVRSHLGSSLVVTTCALSGSPLWSALCSCFASGMAEPSFPKFEFGAGVTAPGGAPSGELPAPKTPPSLSVDTVIKAARADATLIKEVLKYLKADEDTPLEHLAFVRDDDFMEAIEATKVQEQPLSPLQKGQVLYFVKVLRQTVDKGYVQAVAASPAVQGTVTPNPGGEKRKVSEVLDQIDDSSYEPLPPAAIAQMRGFHRAVTGGDPPDHERPTADQLAALAHRMKMGKAPYADFAVFGPYGRRQTKLLRFTAQVFVHGELVTRQLRGPGSYHGWRSSWGVFRASMIMLNAASPAALDKYARGIEELVALYPQAWGVISVADESMRSERWDILKESADVDCKWEDIISDSSFGFSNGAAHWWYLHVIGPMTGGAPRGAYTTVAVLEGVGPGTVDHGEQPSGRKNNARGKKEFSDKSGFKGASNKQVCNQFNQGGCSKENCNYAHACSGCGGRFPFSRCWTCNPRAKQAKGAGKAKPSETGKAPGKKRKGPRGGGAPSTR